MKRQTVIFSTLLLFSSTICSTAGSSNLMAQEAPAAVLIPTEQAVAAPEYNTSKSGMLSGKNNGNPNPAIVPVSIGANSAGVLRGQPVQLFDGESLAGWTNPNGKPSPNWKVEDGLLTRSKRGGDLYHEHWYTDFELSFTWKMLANGNSGVKYRVQDYGKRKLGCEYQLQDDKENLFNKHATGSIYAIYEPAKTKQLSPLGEWNESKIVVYGNRIEHWLNGQLVVQANVGDADWLSRVAASKFSDKPQFGENHEGRIFLQDHGHPVWFKKIELIPLAHQPVFMPFVDESQVVFPGSVEGWTIDGRTATSIFDGR